uniref:Genome polyprotein n=1 Tax=Insectivora picornavirus TaxID=3039002 RepID=A0AAT9TZ12_9PICO|nr:MAG: structural polyprotein [Insectivora picornavirus]
MAIDLQFELDANLIYRAQSKQEKRMIMSESKNQTKPAVEALSDNDLRETEVVKDQQELTQFLDEAAEIKTEVETKEIKLPPNPYINQDISDILARAYPITTFQWTRNDSEGSCIKRFSFPEALFNQKIIWEKINHFEFFRADLKIKVKINASLYHYGKLIGVWRPIAMGKTTYVCMPGDDRTPGAYDNMYSLSSNPHMVVSPNNTDSNEMEIPFAIPLDWIDLKAYATPLNMNSHQRIMNNMGIFELWVLNPLVAKNIANDPPAYVTVYASFENVEIAGYTTTSIQYIQHELQLYTSKITPSGIFGIDDYKVINDMPKAQSKTTGISYAPMHIASSQPEMDYTQVLNLSVPKKDDSLTQYLTEPCLLMIKEIATSASAGTNVAKIPVRPNVMPYSSQYPYSIYRAIFHNRLSFYSQLFRYWRGTIRYSFQITCSRFHSMRLRVYWSPSALKDTDRTNAEAFTISKVVDIEGETNFEMDVPWLQPWKALQIGSRKNGKDDLPNGFLYVDVVNPIVYPESPIPPIRMNVWISAGTDFEFVLLRSHQYELPYKVMPEPNTEYKVNQIGERIQKLGDKVDEMMRDSYPHLYEDEAPKMQAFEPMIEVGSQMPIQKAPEGKELKDGITSLSHLTGKPSFFMTIPKDKSEQSIMPFSIERTLYYNTNSGYFAKNSIYTPVLMTHAMFNSDIRLKVLYFDGSIITITPDCGSDLSTTSVSPYPSTPAEALRNDANNQLAYFDGDMTVRDVIVPTYTNLRRIPFIVTQTWSSTNCPVLFPKVLVTAYGATTDSTVLASLENLALSHPVGPPLDTWVV